VAIDQLQDQERKRRRNERKQRKRDRKAEYKRLLKRRLKHIAELRELWARIPPQPEDLLDEIAACLWAGGTEPIDPSTLWRRYSPPIKIGPQAVRWPLKNLQADRARMNPTNSEVTAE